MYCLHRVSYGSLLHLNIIPSPYFLVWLNQRTLFCCGQPHDLNSTMSLDTFPIPLVPLLPSTPAPSTTTHVRVSSWRWHCQIWPPLPMAPIDAAKSSLMQAQNCLHPTHFLTAFLLAAAGTEPPDDANRSIGQTYCIRTAGDGPQRLQASLYATVLWLYCWCCYAIH